VFPLDPALPLPLLLAIWLSALFSSIVLDLVGDMGATLFGSVGFWHFCWGLAMHLGCDGSRSGGSRVESRRV
jgi:hypothetical protein